MMKNFLKKSLSIALNEMNIKKKKIFGVGDYHRVYRFNKYPDRLFKIGHDKIVDKWVELFSAYPEYFPKVYRTFPYKSNPGFKVVEIEMLDTESAVKDFNKVNDFIEDHFDRLSYNKQIITIDNFFEDEPFEIMINAVKKEQPELVDLFYKYRDTLSAVAPIVKKYLGRLIDLHYGNVGYDKNKNLKLIDV